MPRSFTNTTARNQPLPDGIRRRWVVAIALGWTALTASPGWIATSSADFPEMVERVGRFCGLSWGDGYHACHSSGMRPLANLPPRSYPARTGTMMEKVGGCQACLSLRCNGSCQDGYTTLRPMMLPSVPRTTFYDRFDEYSRQVSFRAAAHEAGAYPVDPIIDHESNGYQSSASPHFDLNFGYLDEVSQDGFSVLMPSGPDDALKNDNESEPPVQLTPEELESFRQYQEQQRLQEKYQKYLIEPEQMDPYQTFGGPPVGSEQRRELDQRKVEQLLKKRRAPAVDEPQPTDEDLLPSFSDRSLEQDDLPMDDLLPPYPDELDSMPAPESEFPVPNNDLLPEEIPAGRELFDGEASAWNLKPTHPSQQIAEVPDWRFVRQPR